MNFDKSNSKKKQQLRLRKYVLCTLSFPSLCMNFKLRLNDKRKVAEIRKIIGYIRLLNEHD